MNPKTKILRPPASSNRQLLISRIIEAPPARVFQAWTDPCQFARWWGPHGFNTPACQMNLRPGGVFHTIMRGMDGREYATRAIFLEIVAPVRIIFTDAFEENWQPSPHAFMTAIVRFDEHEAGTHYSVRALHWTAADRQTHEQMGFHQGWAESTERLAAVVGAGWLTGD